MPECSRTSWGAVAAARFPALFVLFAVLARMEHLWGARALHPPQTYLISIGINEHSGLGLVRFFFPPTSAP